MTVHDAMASASIAGLPQEATERILALLAEHPSIQRVVLYGSRALERHRPGSDIDICLEAPDMGLAELLVLGGQVMTPDLSRGEVRQRGIQEIDGVSIVKSITAHASTIETVAALKEATVVQQAEMKKLDMNKMEDLFDDLADMMADQEEI